MPDKCVTWREKSTECAFFEGDEEKPENCVSFDRFDNGNCASVDPSLKFYPGAAAGEPGRCKCMPGWVFLPHA